MESGVDFSDGLQLWGDFSWVNLIDSAASVSVMLSTIAVGLFNLAMIPFFLRALLHFARGSKLSALKNLLTPPLALGALLLAYSVGPYALLGLWSGASIAGVSYAVARRLTLWRLARRFPEALEALGYDRRFRKIFFQSGRRVRWMFDELGDSVESSTSPLGTAAVAKPKASV